MSADTRTFLMYWIGFSAFFSLLQFIFNDRPGPFAYVVSVVAALPIAALLLYLARRNVRGH
jgi:hypothetical protein